MPKAKKQAKMPKRRTSRLSNPSNPTFGPVSTINTAPVAIGNSMRGFKAQVVRNSLDSVRIVGRDYAFTAFGTGSVTGWELVGGFPLTPACFVSSIIRNYARMYNKFKFNQLRVHYITSSPTSASGDVLFQINANRTDPIPNWTAANFLPYALSKIETIIGPLWTNHSVAITPVGPTRTMVTGQNNDIDYQSQGEILMFTKTSTTSSPGYVLFDYDITFSEQSVNPKQAVIPNPQLLYQPLQLVWSTAALTAGSTVPSLTFGTTGPGATTLSNFSSLPGYLSGDVYKLCIDVTNSNMAAYTVSAGATPTSATLLSLSAAGTTTAFALNDGFTIYMVVQGAAGSATATLYSEVAEAFTVAARLVSGVTGTPNTYAETSKVPNAGVWLFGFASWCGNINANNLQQA